MNHCSVAATQVEREDHSVDAAQNVMEPDVLSPDDKYMKASTTPPRQSPVDDEGRAFFAPSTASGAVIPSSEIHNPVYDVELSKQQQQEPPLMSQIGSTVPENPVVDAEETLEQADDSEPDPIQGESVPRESQDSATPSSRFSIPELQRLLTSLNDDDDDDDQVEDIRTAGEAANIEYEDDRTLLDVFGEVAHDFLTKKVIPPTSEYCRWDWRSLECEPACQCAFQPLWGDYHLGRSCRRTTTTTTANNSTDSCTHSRSTVMSPPETALPRRLVRLLGRTARGLQRRSQRLATRVVVQSAVRLSHMQNHVCAELWTLLYYHHDHELQEKCWPRRQVPIPTIPERLLCGPIDFPICPAAHDNDDETAEQYYYPRKVFAPATA